jgi:hypothetical protein
MHNHNNRALFKRIESERMKACYNQLTNSIGFQEEGQVWLYHTTWMSGVIKVTAFLGRPLQGDHQDQCYGLQIATSHQREDDGGAP